MHFKSALQAAITKLAEPSTVQQGQEEIEDLMVLSVHLSEQDRMNVVLYHVSEMFSSGETGSMKACLRRELMRVIAKVAEVFQEGMAAQMPKVIAFFSKRMKDTSDANMQAVVAETLSKIMCSVSKQPENEQISSLLKSIYQIISNANKVQQ